MGCGGGVAAPPHRGRDRCDAQHYCPEQLAGCPLRSLDQPLPRLRTWLCLLLCPAEPCLAWPLAGAGFRDKAACEARGGRAASSSTAPSRLCREADGDGNEYRSLSADRE